MAPRVATSPTPSATRSAAASAARMLRRHIAPTIVPTTASTIMLTVALITAMAGFALSSPAFAGDRPNDDDNAPRQNFMTLEDLLQRANVWNDPKYVRGWSSYCTKNPERGGCETILRRYGHRPVIGIVLAPDEARGVRIAGVTPEGPADRAGIKAGDRLIAINGNDIEGGNGQARVENARRVLLGFKSKDTVHIRYERDDRAADASMQPKLDMRLMVLASDGRVLPLSNDLKVRRDRQGRFGIETDGTGLKLLDDKPVVGEPAVETPGNAIQIAGVNPGRSLLLDPDCNEGRDCSPLRLSEAFRWNGFNLAAVDPQLGRYFGATEGVLVLSSSPLLPELQAGDVIRKIDGIAVATPRAVMDALRSKPAESMVEFELIRDRRDTRARIKLPESLAVIPAIPGQYADPADRPPPRTGSRIRR